MIFSWTKFSCGISVIILICLSLGLTSLVASWTPISVKGQRDQQLYHFLKRQLNCSSDSSMGSSLKRVVTFILWMRIILTHTRILLPMEGSVVWDVFRMLLGRFLENIFQETMFLNSSSLWSKTMQSLLSKVALTLSWRISHKDPWWKMVTWRDTQTLRSGSVSVK